MQDGLSADYLHVSYYQTGGNRVPFDGELEETFFEWDVKRWECLFQES